eukprot:6185980-Pleurochrysis_carterae.AAC.2
MQFKSCHSSEAPLAHLLLFDEASWALEPPSRLPSPLLTASSLLLIFPRRSSHIPSHLVSRRLSSRTFSHFWNHLITSPPVPLRPPSPLQPHLPRTKSSNSNPSLQPPPPLLPPPHPPHKGPPPLSCPFPFHRLATQCPPIPRLPAVCRCRLTARGSQAWLRGERERRRRRGTCRCGSLIPLRSLDGSGDSEDSVGRST